MEGRITVAALRLKSFSVVGLFGLFDHDLRFKTQDRITILHGPNGVGKTTILRLIEAVFRPRSGLWREVDFKRITVQFLPKGTLTITPVRTKNPRDAGMVYAYRVGKEMKDHKVEILPEPDLPLRMIDDVIPWLDRVSHRLWRDHRGGGILGFEEVIERYEDMLHIPRRKRSKTPEWFTELLGKTAVQFIRTQRLRMATSDERHPRPGRDDKEQAVERLADDLARRIKESLRDSGSLAASLDRTFPKRLLEGALPKDATESNIRTKYQEQQKLRDRLMAAGLLDAGEQVPLPGAELGESERKVLWYYLKDVNEKLQVYLSLLERVELFKGIIDDKNFLYKSMGIDKDDGFHFKSERGTTVPLSSLSSGEQHELVLTYELLFGAQDKHLILIDEPELSLHVLWQQKFLEDMKRIAQVADLDFVIATHSPSIVADRDDLMVELLGEGGRA